MRAGAARDHLDAGRDRLGDHLEVPELLCCIGDGSVGEFYSVALSNHHQQADTGTKMIHIGRNTRSTIVSKGISRRARPEHLPRPGQGRADARTARATTRNATRC